LVNSHQSIDHTTTAHLLISNLGGEMQGKNNAERNIEERYYFTICSEEDLRFFVFDRNKVSEATPFCVDLINEGLNY
jgi:hypothetical protein